MLFKFLYENFASEKKINGIFKVTDDQAFEVITEKQHNMHEIYYYEIYKKTSV